MHRKLKITLAISTSGATSARSRIARMIAITSSATGAISFRSDSIASSKSYWIAEPPPTSAVRPGSRSSTAERIAGTASNASGVNGSPSRITSTVPIEPSSETFGVGVADATLSTPLTAPPRPGGPPA